MFRNILFIGSASGWGAPDKRCGDGPDALVKNGYLPCFQHLDKTVCPSIRLLQPKEQNAYDELYIVTDMCEQIAEAVTDAINSDHFPVVLGGDHSSAIGTWAGVHRATRNQGETGLIWVDAHMDSHTPSTSHSGQIHGMPLACLMGYGDNHLTHLGEDAYSIHPDNICLLGIRSYEREEKALLDKLGVRVITMDEINQNGFEAAWDEAVEVVSKNTSGFGVSIDLDAIDPLEAPGVGSPESGGIHARDLINCLHTLRDIPTIRALEIAEYNPYRDHNNATAALMTELITAVLK